MRKMELSINKVYYSAQIKFIPYLCNKRLFTLISQQFWKQSKKTRGLLRAN